MRVVVLGSGGREHALAWGISRSPSVDSLRVWPGNGGTALAGWQVGADELNGSEALEILSALSPDLVVIGPEQPLVDGLADALRERGIAVFGPGAAAAQLEGSKIFAKRFMEKHGIPTARSCVVTDAAGLGRALDEMGDAIVLKADGLAAGKGVLLPDSREEAMGHGEAMLDGSSFGAAGRSVLVEERLDGWELSLLAVCDGQRYEMLPPSQDHKRALEGDRGLNTGGMGAYSPVPSIDDATLAELGELVFAQTLKGLNAEGLDYRGILYAGLMMTADGPRVLEFNCRFGDPETQVIVPRLGGDLAMLLAGAAAGKIPEFAMTTRPGAAITVVLASAGYPGAYETGFPITGLDAEMPETMIFHAGTQVVDNQVLSSGGRVLAVSAIGRDLAQAADRCYRRLEHISFSGRTFRRDIAWRVLSKGGVG